MLNTRQLFAVYVLVSALLVSLLAGCETLSGAFSGKEKSSDPNVIIPKLMQDWTVRKPEEAAAELFDVTSPDERREAIAFLAKQTYGHEPPYMKAYTFLTTDPSAMVRAQAFRALGGAGSPEVVGLLIGKNTKSGGIKDADPLVRADCARALYDSFSDEAIDPLIDVLKNDESAQVRCNAARALVRSNDPRVIKALIEALADHDAVVVNDAARSLNQITGQYIGFAPRPWMEWYKNQTWAKAPAASEPAN